jgi:hypothetical protein
MERRLDELPLVGPRRAARGQQAVAANSGDLLRTAGAAPEIALVSLQHVLDVLGVVDEMNDSWAEPETDDVAVAPGGIERQSEHVGAKRMEVAE